MPKTYSPSFKAKMVARLTGADALSANLLSKEIGIPNSTLSRWVREAKGRPHVSQEPAGRKFKKAWSFEEKLRILNAAQGLSPTKLSAYLRSEGVHPAQLKVWRESLEDSRVELTAEKRIKALERELRRKEKALAEAAALLVLQKKMEQIWGAEDEGTEDESES